MKRGSAHKTIAFIVLVMVSILLPAFSHKDQESGVEACRKFVLTNLEQIHEHLDRSLSILTTRDQKDKKQKLIEEYRSCRKYYKAIEFFIEYYSAYEAKYFINGPLVPKYDFDVTASVIEPQGFQAIEQELYGKDAFDSLLLSSQYELLNTKFRSLKEYYSTLDLEQEKLCEALKLQLIRIMCLTLNGYDCTINKETIPETYDALESVQKVSFMLAPTAPKKNTKALIKHFSASLKFLRKHPDSDAFDRLKFITGFLDPTYSSLVAFFQEAGIKSSALAYAVNLQVRSFFANNAINKQYFSLYQHDTLHLKAQAALGKLLFFDPVLSSNNKRACASCHRADKAFADGMEKSPAFEGHGTVSRNAPGLVNIACQKLFFYDGRIFNLEEQANAVLNNKTEMNNSAGDVVNRLRQSSEYAALFKKAFKGTADSAISFFSVLKSIAEFVKTLDARNSRFDKYLRGDHKQLSKSEIRGFNLFSGKALCGSCHFFPLFNGTVPPMYNDSEFEVLGVPEDSTNKSLDADPGREKITKKSIHAHAFKTPTLRNAALTAPYMHNGAYRSLDQVLEFYNKGGGAGFGITVENQTLPFDSLSLSKKELTDLKSFMISLTDTAGLSKAPERLPTFPDKALNRRKIGGEY